MQVYLPDELYEAIKARRLRASEILQKAVRAELRRLDVLAETDRYLEELRSGVGAPRQAERTRARDLAIRVSNRSRRKAG
jgi:post-segregation antitoxin (ccd killing protein)